MGTLKQKITQDNTGKEGSNTVFKDSITAPRLPEIMTNFIYGKDVAEITETVANGGAITIEDSMIKVSTSTATDGAANVSSIHSVRYRPGCEFYAFFTARFSAGVAGATQLCGPVNDSNGFALGMDGTDFIILRKDNSTDHKEKQGTFNRDNLDGTGSTRFTLIPTNLNLYRITFGWLGVASIYFEVMEPDGSWLLFHVMQVSGKLTQPHIGIPYLPISLDVTKTSGDTDVTAFSGSWNAGIVGQPSKVGDKLNATAALDTAYLFANGEQHIITIHAKTTFNSTTNKIESVIQHLTLATDGTKNVLFRVYQNATITTPSYADVDTTFSMMEVDTSATISGGKFLLPSVLGKTDSKDLDIEHLQINQHPDDTITVTAESAGNSDVTVGLAWDEKQ